jgi:Glycosyl hydrolase family 12
LTRQAQFWNQRQRRWRQAPPRTPVNDSLPGTGNFDSAYDIWADNNADKIMLWTYTQNVGPLGSYQTTASIGGSSRNIYRGSNGSNAVDLTVVDQERLPGLRRCARSGG